VAGLVGRLRILPAGVLRVPCGTTAALFSYDAFAVEMILNKKLVTTIVTSGSLVMNPGNCLWQTFRMPAGAGNGPSHCGFSIVPVKIESR